jgi:hypothetical protein
MPHQSDRSLTSVQITFPDVCKMPGPPAPFVPTPLPNIGSAVPAGGSVQRQGIRERSPAGQALVAAQRAKMSSLHNQLQSLPSTASAQQWQDLLEQYVIAAAESFKALHGR